MNGAALPVTPDANFENCVIPVRLQIVNILRDMAARRVLVTAHFNEGREFIVTMVLAVEPESDEFVIDLGADRVANAHLLAAARFTLVTFLDHIKIQFDTGPAQETSHLGAPALCTRIPAFVVRLQRRAFYRVKVPASRPVLCRLPHPAQPGKWLDLNAYDLSVGGVMLPLPSEEFDIAPGARIDDCRMTIPDHGHFQASLIVRNAEVLPGGPRQRLKRLGCEFVCLPPHVISLIQRYVLQVERSRIGMRR
jgi:c-di-GMP-binding flagellar brake protein YcgR